MTESFKGKRVLITGVCGTVGLELLNQIIAEDPAEVIGIDNAESNLFFLDDTYREKDNVSFFLCDIRNQSRLRSLFEGIDIVLHAAALKHVILNELSPAEAIQTNILGTQNVIDAAKETGVQRVIFTSSDKAVNPTNVMGTSKLMGERLMTAANASKRDQFPIFASTRFGNVLGSNGSVIPLFKKQILAGGPVTLTDEGMSRFVMTLQEAASLVSESVFIAKGGEVFVTKMPSINIKDLAVAMIDILKERGEIEKEVEIKIIGSKPGEKLYEELINEEEIRRTIEIENYFTVLPAFRSGHLNIEYKYGNDEKKVDKIYRSDLENCMSIDELKKYLSEKEIV